MDLPIQGLLALISAPFIPATPSTKALLTVLTILFASRPASAPLQNNTVIPPATFDLPTPILTAPAIETYVLSPREVVVIPFFAIVSLLAAFILSVITFVYFIFRRPNTGSSSPETIPKFHERGGLGGVSGPHPSSKAPLKGTPRRWAALEFITSVVKSLTRPIAGPLGRISTRGWCVLVGGMRTVARGVLRCTASVAGILRFCGRLIASGVGTVGSCCKRVASSLDICSASFIFVVGVISTTLSFSHKVISRVVSAIAVVCPLVVTISIIRSTMIYLSFFLQDDVAESAILSALPTAPGIRALYGTIAIGFLWMLSLCIPVIAKSVLSLVAFTFDICLVSLISVVGIITGILSFSNEVISRVASAIAVVRPLVDRAITISIILCTVINISFFLQDDVAGFAILSALPTAPGTRALYGTIAVGFLSMLSLSMPVIIKSVSSLVLLVVPYISAVYCSIRHLLRGVRYTWAVLLSRVAIVRGFLWRVVLFIGLLNVQYGSIGIAVILALPSVSFRPLIISALGMLIRVFAYMGQACFRMQVHLKGMDDNGTVVYGLWLRNNYAAWVAALRDDSEGESGFSNNGDDGDEGVTSRTLIRVVSQGFGLDEDGAIAPDATVELSEAPVNSGFGHLSLDSAEDDAATASDATVELSEAPVNSVSTVEVPPTSTGPNDDSQAPGDDNEATSTSSLEGFPDVSHVNAEEEHEEEHSVQFSAAALPNFDVVRTYSKDSDLPATTSNDASTSEELLSKETQITSASDPNACTIDLDDGSRPLAIAGFHATDDVSKHMTDLYTTDEGDSYTTTQRSLASPSEPRVVLPSRNAPYVERQTLRATTSDGNKSHTTRSNIPRPNSTGTPFDDVVSLGSSPSVFDAKRPSSAPLFIAPVEVDLTRPTPVSTNSPPSRTHPDAAIVIADLFRGSQVPDSDVQDEPLIRTEGESCPQSSNFESGDEGAAPQSMIPVPGPSSAGPARVFNGVGQQDPRSCSGPSYQGYPTHSQQSFNVWCQGPPPPQHQSQRDFRMYWPQQPYLGGNQLGPPPGCHPPPALLHMGQAMMPGPSRGPLMGMHSSFASRWGQPPLQPPPQMANIPQRVLVDQARGRRPRA